MTVSLTCDCRYLIGHLGDSAAILCTGHTSAVDADVQPSGTALTALSGLRAAAAAASGRLTGTATESHGSHAVSLTCDHSPARTDEAARIIAAGGRITTTPGTLHLTACLRPQRPVLTPLTPVPKLTST